MKKKSVYYWSPFLTPIATCKAVINSAYSLNRFGKDFDATIMNFFGEFNQNISEITQKKINLLNFYNLNIINYLPKYGKISSRISFLIFFMLGFLPLLKILKKKPPDYIVIHLITSLPLILLVLFSFKTKFILRISGLPRINMFRKLLWKLAFKKIHLITCPTNETNNYLKSLNLCDKKKFKILFDPIIHVSKINNKIKDEIDQKGDFYVAVGRLTKQKNFLFLCECFKELIKRYPTIKLFIIGEGENFYLLNNFIKTHKLTNNILLLGYKKNIFPYFKKAKGFILSSLWEDPGFVLIEAAFCRLPVFSSDAKPGPYEIIKNNLNGTTFKNNDINSFLKNFDNYLKNSENSKIVLENLKLSRKFSIFNHYKDLSSYLV